MENKANYFLVGLFVFGVFFASLIFMLFLGGYSKDESYKSYQIFTQESVAGLGIKAPVRLLGVEVGDVEDMEIVSNENLMVKITIRVKEKTPIKTDTVASMGLQGITGLKFIQLQGGSEDAPDLLAKKGEDLPTIAFKESLLSSIDKQGERIVNIIKRADDKSRELLKEENIKNIDLILANLAASSETVSNNLSVAGLKISQMAERVSLAAGRFVDTLDKANLAFGRVGAFFDRASEKLERIDEASAKISQDLVLLQDLLIESRELMKELRASPSDLFFKKSSPQNGPGE